MHFGFIKDITARDDHLLVGLDMGTTKVCAVVAEVKSAAGSTKDVPRGTAAVDINIVGVGSAPSRGIRKGVVINIEGTVESIREAVAEAESAANVAIKAVHIGMTGEHIQCIPSNGVIAVKEKEIDRKEIERVVDAARAVAIPFDREILHVIPVGYTVNGQNGITDPRGMAGVRLETDVQIITGATSAVQNLIRSCDKAGLEVIDIVFQPLASADAVLSQDERDLGVAVIDIGGGTTDIILFYEDRICHSAVLPLGGIQFTNDLAIGLRIPTQEAERIKRDYGCSMMSLVREDDEVEVGYADGRLFRRVPRRYLVEIIQPRAEELFILVKQQMRNRGLDRLMNAGVVLTGGGVLLEGMDVMAENILELPVRIGTPVGFGGSKHSLTNPIYATAVGLTRYGASEVFGDQRLREGSFFSVLRNRMGGWLNETFR